MTRHLFDQYDQHENRLTHALVCSLAEDPRLLRRFVRWAFGAAPPKGSRLRIVEQRLPGEAEEVEDETKRHGLPDAWIYNDEGWALILENKVASDISTRQLRRHLATAVRRGFDDVHLLVMDVARPRKPLADDMHFRAWPELYAWCVRQSRHSTWAQRLAGYMEVAEGRMIADGYLKEGTLTTFSGIPFDDDNPYNWREAKRLLKLAMDKLQARKDLKNHLGVDPRARRRPAITGRGGISVWDFIPLKKAQSVTSFVKYPHFTFAIKQDRLEAELIIPSGIDSGFRRNLVDLGERGFFNLIGSVEKRLTRTLRGGGGAAPFILAYQRRFPSQKARPMFDAKVEFDLRTAFGGAKSKPRVCYQPQWLEAIYRVLEKKKSNFQIGLGAVFPYGRCPLVRKAKILDYVAKAWLATKPVLNVLLGRASRE